MRTDETRAATGVDRDAVLVLSPTSPVSALAVTPVVVMEAGATIGEAATAMARADVPVVVHDRGVVTEGDIVRAIAAGLDAASPVSDIDRAPAVTVEADATIAHAAGRMLNERTRHLVVRAGDRVSVVSMSDVTAVLLQVAGPEIWLDGRRVTIDEPSEVWLG